MAEPVNEEVEVCRNFRNRGRCRHGEQCRFAHTEGEPIPVVIKARGLCHQFTESGECKFAEKCRFFHGSVEDAEIERQERQKKADEKAARREAAKNAPQGEKKEGGRRRNRRRRRKPAGDEKEVEDPLAGVPITPEEDRVDADGKEICRNFRNKNGQCRWGDNCKHSHSEGPKINIGAPPRPKKANRPKRNRKPKASGPCRAFLENGECKFGDECRFKHGEEDARDLDAINAAYKAQKAEERAARRAAAAERRAAEAAGAEAAGAEAGAGDQ